MSNNDKGLAEAVPKVEKEAVEFLLIFSIKASRGFISKDQFGIVHQGTCYSHTLFLATGKFVWFVAGTLCKSHKVQQFHGTLFSFLVRGACYEGRHHHIFQGSELGQKLVKLEDEADVAVAETCHAVGGKVGNILACYDDTAFVGSVQSAYNLQQRGLASTAGTHDADHLALAHLQVDALEHLQIAKTLLYSFYLDHDHWSGYSSITLV